MSKIAAKLSATVSTVLVVASVLGTGAPTFASGGKSPSQPGSPLAPDLSLLAAGGTGCPGLTTVQLKGSSLQVGVEFKEFRAETTGQSSLNRKSCSLALPTEIPAGWQLVIEKATVRGIARIPTDGSVTVRLDVFFAGTSGVSSGEEIATSGNFELLAKSEDAADNAVLASACGPSAANLRANLSVILKGKAAQTEILSLGDTQTEGIFGFQWRKCP